MEKGACAGRYFTEVTTQQSHHAFNPVDPINQGSKNWNNVESYNVEDDVMGRGEYHLLIWKHNVNIRVLETS